MNELTIFERGTSFVANATTIVNTLTAGMDTKTARRLRNKVYYDLETLGRSRQIVDRMGLEGRDLLRAEALLDAYTVVARDDILDTK